MSAASRQPWRDRLSRVAVLLVDAAGTLTAILLAMVVVLGWLITGVAHGFTTRWFEILFATTASVTFTMAFLIQHAVKRGNRALSLKLDELIDVHSDADNELLQAERRPLGRQEELDEERPAPGDRA